MKICKYHLLTLKQSESLLEKSGFNIIKSTDISAWIAGLYRENLLRFEEAREPFLQSFGQGDYDHLVNRWQGKIGYVQQKDLVHGLIIAKK